MAVKLSFIVPVYNVVPYLRNARIGIVSVLTHGGPARESSAHFEKKVEEYQ